MDAQWLTAQFDFHPEKTKADLAKALNLEPPAISKILKGTRQIKAQEYMIMRAFFGLPVHDFKNHQNGESFVFEQLQPASSLKDNENADAQWMIPAEIIQKRTNAQAENIKSFRVADQMMVPEFHRDEHVLVDLSDTKPSPQGAFIVSDGYGYLLRNCEFVPQSDPVQIKISALKDTFEPQILKPEDFEIVGRVIAKLQWL